MSSIIHELTLLQEREGWLSEDGLRDLATRLDVPLHRVESVSTFYTHFRRSQPRPVQIEVCRDLSCMLAGGDAALAALDDHFAGRDDVQVTAVSCLGRCERAPACALSSPTGHGTTRCASPAEVEAALGQLGAAAAEPTSELPPEPISEPTTRRWAADPYATTDDRYGTLRRTVASGDRSTLVDTLKTSGLRGMGGAGFPTGLKWGLVAKEPATPRYVVCNADESEPGTFKDREILADLPHLVIEGMVLAAWAIDSSKGWVFIRHEYEPERHALEAAIAEARAAGALGDNIFGSGFSFDIEIFVSPGGYILGEETALLECMEDRRGEPRNKPPFPGSKGLWGQPTLMNNVETFAHAVGIVGEGLEWWQGLGREGHSGQEFSGHKFISVSGDVARPAVYLVPMGSTLRELLEQAGGMADGRTLAAIAPGGASSNFLGPGALDVAIDFQTLADAGSMLGSGAAVFVAEGHDLLQVGVNVARFFRNESCGKCVPCRVGSEKAVAHLEGKDRVSDDDVQLLQELNTTLYQTSICGLGQVALGPLLSIVENFPEQVRRK